MAAYKSQQQVTDFASWL